MTESALHTAPRLFRATVARGLAAGIGDTSPIDRQGGDSGAGLIRGVSLITRGEALGHGLWIDSEFLSEVADAVNASPAGVKARFTHPSLSGDGLGKFLGRVKNAVIDGDRVLADLHLSPTGHNSPDGDLAGYVLDLAERDPEAFGVSISFSHDPEAEAQVIRDGGGTVDPLTGVITGFISPDPQNTDNLPHVRLAKLRAADVVDEPAANPAGLFHRGDQVAAEADAVLSYALGLRTDAPAIKHFDVHPDRVSGFVKRFLNQHGLTVVPVTEGTENMSDTTPDTNKPTTETPTPPAAPTPAEDRTTLGQQFMTAFGEQQGAIYFAKGLSFAEATQQHLQAQTQRITELESRLASADRGAAEPVEFQAESDPADAELAKLTKAFSGNEARARRVLDLRRKRTSQRATK